LAAVRDPEFLFNQGVTAMSSPIDRFFSETVPKFTQQLEDFDRRIDADAEPTDDALLAEISQAIYASLRDCCDLEAQLEGEDPVVIKELQARYRDAIWPWMSKGWCINRSITKPRGYPGDYQMLTAIYDDVPKAKGLGGYLDRFWLNLTLAKAVFGRMLSLRKFLNEEFATRHGKIAVLDVACGACREFTEEFSIPSENVVALTCVDNDQEALDYVRDNVASQLPENMAVDYVRYNALRMTSSEATIRKFGRSDIIYSVGLCDYIPDEYLIPLLQGWRESLTDGGLVYVAFKDTLQYDKTEYQWFMDWYFFQRTEEEFLQLFEKAGYDMSRIEMTRDRTGVILNYVCRTASPAEMLRVDAAQQAPVGQHAEMPIQASSAVQPH
jgi:extracellular factor (EF) 3-hydroxypalmitic acid methyl ester biosynthesis protein